MSEEKKQQLEEIRDEIRQLREMLHNISVKEAAIARRLDPIEKAAMEIREDRVSFAIRDAYIALVSGGRLLTEIHMDINVPPTVFRTEEEQKERAA